MSNMNVSRVRVRGKTEFFSRVVAARQPVVLEGVIDRWPLLRGRPSVDSVLARLRGVAGHRTVKVSWAHARHKGLLSYGLEGDGIGRNWAYSERRFASFLDDLQAEQGEPSHHALYLAAGNIPQSLPELSRLVPMPLLGPKQRTQFGPLLWIGNGGHRAALHYDDTDNLNCLFMGEKRFALLPPSALPYVYMGDIDRGPGGAPTAMVDPLAPDLDKYPRFKQVQDQLLIADVKAGDVLFIPAYWLHHVESTGLNAAVNFWWSDLRPSQVAAAEACLAHALLGLRSLPAYERAFYRILFDYLVFGEYGDPFVFLPPGKQGWTGVPSPEREAALKELVVEFVRATYATRSFEPTSRYQVVDSATYRFTSTGAFEAIVAGKKVSLNTEMWKVLCALQRPQQPLRLARKLFPRSERGRGLFLKVCAHLSDLGLISKSAGAVHQRNKVPKLP